ncbi:DUF3017 domain-containing protein [Ruania alba]|uniref:DUF3017 domain-containing protein n=1 Tax=Ruania alba TaxID=648782 RepID=A0A1H5CJT5_9MICO|nr:DUF3017 domain-containing protein [Ruania alba]SED66698.1 Protein of unknown function [Ruania alba]
MTTPRPTPRPVEPGHWRRYVVMWIALAWLLAAFVVMIVEGARPGALVIASELVVLGFVRAVTRSPGPYGITSRSRAFDVAVLMLSGIGIGTLALIASGLDPL